MNPIMQRGEQTRRWFPFILAVLAGVAIGVPPAAANGQLPQSVIGAPTCAACRIEVSRLFTVDDGSENAILEDWPFSITMDSRGRIALSVRGGVGLAVLYDSLGRSPRRIGRLGSGPNEYRRPTTVAFGAGDTLNVFDLELARRTELVGNAQAVRSAPYVGRSALLRVLPNSDLLVVRGTQFHLYSKSGSLIRSWGQAFPAVPGGTRLPERFISNIVANKFWSVNAETYELEQWSIDGTRLSQLRREADWFDRSKPVSDGLRGDAPSAYVGDLHLDRDGRRLWVLINVPSKNWRSGLGPVDTKRSFISYPNADLGKLFESFVDVIDVGTMKLQQSIRVPAYLRYFVSEYHVAALRQSEDGSPLVDVWRLVLNSPNGGSK